MEKEPNNFEDLFDKAGNYAETRIELWKFKATKKASIIIATLVAKMIKYVLLAFFIILLNIGLAIWLGELLGKVYYGFFILAAFYLVAGLIFSSFKDQWVKNPLSDSFIKNMYD